MHLLIDATRVGGRVTGIERYVAEVAGRLAQVRAAARGKTTLLVSPHGVDWAGKWAGSGTGDIDVRVAPIGSKLLIEQIWIPLAVVRSRADVLYFPGFPPSPLVFLVGKGARVVRTLFDAAMWARPDTVSLKNRLYFRPAEEFGSRRYALVHTISDHARSEIVHYFPWLADRITVSGCGVSSLVRATDWNESPVRADERYLLFVGTIEPRKNLPFLIRVFARLRQREPDLKLVIAGRAGWGVREVEAAVGASGVGDSVVITGAVTDAALAFLYEHALCLAYASIYEGFGLPVVEAMSRGVPVVCSNSTSLPEVCGDAAVLLDASDETAWVEALTLLIRNPDQRSRLASAGLERAKYHSWPAVAERIRATL